MNAETLKSKRGDKRSQEEMAFLLGTNQKHVSLMETDKLEIPELMASTISRGVENVIVEDQYSLPYEIHEFFWKRASNRAAALTVSCWIYPAKDKRFANGRVELKFEGLETRSPDNESGGSLIMDVMGNPSGPDKKPSVMELGWPESNESVLPKEIRAARPGCIAARAKCVEHGDKLSRPAHKLAYEVSYADGYEDILLNVFSENGYELSERDTIGFPVFPDFVLDRISFRAHLFSLSCPAKQPVFTPFLIRRANERAVPARLSSRGDKKQAVKIEGSENETIFTFGPLLRPAPGYIYSISWDKLIPQ